MDVLDGLRDQQQKKESQFKRTNMKPWMKDVKSLPSIGKKKPSYENTAFVIKQLRIFAVRPSIDSRQALPNDVPQISFNYVCLQASIVNVENEALGRSNVMRSLVKIISSW